MVHAVAAKRSMSPEREQVSIKRCRLMDAKLTDKFTLHRGRLSKLDAAWHKKFRHVSAQDRDIYVAALYALTCNMGLMQETIHICISLLDRFLKIQPITLEWLEVVSIACIWIAAKFNETQSALETLRIKETLKQRQGRGRGNWSWHHVLVLECQILKRLGFRILGPSVLRSFHKDIGDGKINMSDEQLHNANYFLDLSLMDSTIQSFPIGDVVDAIVVLTTKFKPNANFSFESVESRVREPMLRFFLLHLNIQNELKTNPVPSTHKALICMHNFNLSSQWRHAAAPSCVCRICQTIST